jgi:hypothetical protein
MPFACSICEQESTRICVLCTKDTCSNHLCEKCGCCSDCCGCEVPLVESMEPGAEYAEPIHAETIHAAPILAEPFLAEPIHAEPVDAGPPDPDPEPQPPHPPPDPDPLPGDEPESPAGPISET